MLFDLLKVSLIVIAEFALAFVRTLSPSPHPISCSSLALAVSVARRGKAALPHLLRQFLAARRDGRRRGVEGAMSVGIFLERCARGDARSRERGAVAESLSSNGRHRIRNHDRCQQGAP